MFKKIEDVELRIEHNYQGVKKIESLINDEMSIDDRLSLINICGILYSEYTTGAYSSIDLEKKLFQIGNGIEFEPNKTPNNNEYLFVMTKAGNVGGHSVILNNWILWDKKVKYSVVFTDSCIGDVPDFIKKSVKISGGKLFFLQGFYCEKAKQLLDISKNFSKIILLQHMYDIVPNLAYSNVKWKIPVFLYNHANFKFSFGYTISDMIMNIYNYDVEKTVRFRGTNERKSLLLQFPNAGRKVKTAEESRWDSVNKSDVFLKYGIELNKKLIISMGEEYKFNAIIGCNFIKFVESLIYCRDDVQYIIIGPNPSSHKWKKLKENTKGRARAIGYIGRSEIDFLISSSDLFIASFPMSSSGSNIAEAYNIPYLFMSVTGRGIENYGNNAVSTVEELLQKSNEILDGNKEKYKGTYYKKILNQEQWCNEWHKIADSITVHKGQQIHPQRLIGTEEIVNCQLMQEKASENVKKLLSQFKLTPKIMSALLEINEKYEMDCIPEEFTVIDYKAYQQQNELLQQKMRLLEYSNKWLNLNLKGYHIKDYFEDRGIKSIAIYGMGQIGLNLFEELKNSSVETECFIDRFANMLNGPINIIGLDQSPAISRMIITTVWISEEQLRKDYACLTDEYEIISLFGIIDAICKGE